MQYYDRTSSYIHEKNDDSSQLLALIILALEPFRRKCCIGFDAELNGLQSDPIGFLEVAEGKKNSAKIPAKQRCWNHVKKTIFRLLEFVLTSDRIAVYTVL